MKTRTLLALAAVAAVAAAAYVFRSTLQPPSNGSDAIQSLDSFGALPVVTPAGQKVDLSKLQGQIVIVHFWATWCPPCVEELPTLDRFWQQEKGKRGLSLYVVSVDDSWKAIQEFRAKTPFDLPLFRDPGGETARRFGTTKFPETYIANRNGRILYHLSEPIDWDDASVRTAIDNLLAKS